MILDSGICTVFRKVDDSKPGGKPKFRFDVLCKHWYAELEYANTPAYPTDSREETQTGARIRILQDRRIANHDTVVLANTNQVEDMLKAYEVTRAYHGKDSDSGELITDITLRRVRP